MQCVNLSYDVKLKIDFNCFLFATGVRQGIFINTMPFMACDMTNVEF